jgi:amino-acid N-acetyltransferase
VNILIQSATPADRPAIRALLVEAGLPVEDLESGHVLFWIARNGDAIAGAIGLERSGASGLLRSLAVDAAHREHGLGTQLVDALERKSLETGIKDLFLLTQTAELFFERRGYATVERANVPQDVRTSAEFRTLCPASAVCMTKSLSA